jgi:hypothetical protein
VPAPEAPAPELEIVAVSNDVPAPAAEPVVDTALQAPAPEAPAAPADQTVTVEADWTQTDQPAADQPQVWALHGAPLAPATDPAVPPVLPTTPAPAAAPAPAADGTTAVASGQLPDGVPHLTSPDNPPPGTSTEPVGPQSGPNVSYLKELWHAVQTQEISRNDALLALTQRPMTTPVTNDPRMGALPGDPAAPAAPAVPAPADVPPVQ